MTAKVRRTFSYSRQRPSAANQAHPGHVVYPSMSINTIHAYDVPLERLSS